MFFVYQEISSDDEDEVKVIETNEEETDDTTCKESSSLKQQQQQLHNDDKVEDDKGIKHNKGRPAIFAISSIDNDNSATTTNSDTNYETHPTSPSNQASLIIIDDTFSVDNSTPSTTSCLLYTSPSPRDKRQSRMPSSA